MTLRLTTLNENFRWTRDEVDGWRILRGPGPLRGDCDDYAVTAAYRLANESYLRFWFNVLTFKYVFWYVTSFKGNGHLVLWVRGRGYIDNMSPSFTQNTPHTKKFPHTPLSVAIKMLVGKFTR